MKILNNSGEERVLDGMIFNAYEIREVEMEVVPEGFLEVKEEKKVRKLKKKVKQDI